jgi:hypothetical protein
MYVFLINMQDLVHESMELSGQMTEQQLNGSSNICCDGTKVSSSSDKCQQRSSSQRAQCIGDSVFVHLTDKSTYFRPYLFVAGQLFQASHSQQLTLREPMLPAKQQQATRNL